jgi:hypothetical protein
VLQVLLHVLQWRSFQPGATRLLRLLIRASGVYGRDLLCKSYTHSRSCVPPCDATIGKIDAGSTGTVTINGKATLAVLTDDEGKGDFSAPNNSLLLDLSGDGRFDWKTEGFMIQDAFRLGGTTCEITGITPSGASFQLVKSTRSPAK